MFDSRYLSRCGVWFICSCGCRFASRQSLLKHSRCKNHFTQYETNQIEPDSSQTISNKRKAEIEPPTLLAKPKYMRILPKPSVIDYEPPASARFDRASDTPIKNDSDERTQKEKIELELPVVKPQTAEANNYSAQEQIYTIDIQSKLS